MKSRPLIAAAALGLGALVVVVFFRSAPEAAKPVETPAAHAPQNSGSSAGSAPASTIEAPTAALAPSRAPSASAPRLAPPSTPASPAPDTAPAARTATEARQLARAQALSAIEKAADADTPETLKELVSQATSTDPEIREAALDGLVRRGDAAAAPLLREAAAQMKDPRSAVTLLDRAEYLELPSANFTAKPAALKSPQPNTTPAPHNGSAFPKPPTLGK